MNPIIPSNFWGSRNPSIFFGVGKNPPPKPTKVFLDKKIHLSGVEGPKIGLFLPKSHDVFEAAGCPAHHPAINEALEASVLWWVLTR